MKKIQQQLHNMLTDALDQATTTRNAFVDIVTQKNIYVAVAESCSGGKIMDMLTDLPGASQWLWGGWVVYSNQAKIQLGVDVQTLTCHGAVSKECVTALCRAAQQKTKANLILAISGIVGPSGGTVTKPVGTVWLAARFTPLDVEGARVKSVHEHQHKLSPQDFTFLSAYRDLSEKDLHQHRQYMRLIACAQLFRFARRVIQQDL